MALSSGTTHTGTTVAKGCMGAIIQQNVLSERLRSSKLSHATCLYDLKNAFFCPRFSRLVAAILRCSVWPEFFIHKLQNTIITFEVDGERVDLLLGQGAPPGEPAAADEFLHMLHPLLDVWLEFSDFAPQ